MWTQSTCAADPRECLNDQICGEPRRRGDTDHLPETQTHADMPEEVRLKNGITPCTLRVSVGIEDIEDLLAELAEVFKGLK